MNTVFADSFYFFALINPGDPAHLKARAFTESFRGRLLTTGWVLTELGDGWRKPERWRREFVELCGEIRANENITVRETTESLLERGITLFSRRLDKVWSLTDCISLVVMTQAGISEALTADRHFEQAGFVALLK